MTPRDIAAQDATATARVLVRAEGDVREDDLAYVRAKVHAALDRPGLPAVSGEVRVTHAPARHAGQPWSAGGEVRVGCDLVLVHAREASAHELADRLQARLRGQVDRVLHRGEAARRATTPPPWRGGRG
ncbi:hypothetical protein [Streptomyces sp. NPDC018693]|uniref:hypothetical protein n=1 Tax=unclassified Streptomyces TaxID=2593676 RepID=UPI0037A37A37